MPKLQDQEREKKKKRSFFFFVSLFYSINKNLPKLFIIKREKNPNEKQQILILNIKNEQIKTKRENSRRYWPWRGEEGSVADLGETQKKDWSEKAERVGVWYLCTVNEGKGREGDKKRRFTERQQWRVSRDLGQLLHNSCPALVWFLYFKTLVFWTLFFWLLFPPIPSLFCFSFFLYFLTILFLDKYTNLIVTFNVKIIFISYLKVLVNTQNKYF